MEFKTATPKTKQLRVLVKMAYRNKYGFDNVYIGKDGVIRGAWKSGVNLFLGNIGDVSTIRTDEGQMQVRNRGNVVYTWVNDE